MCIRDSIGIAYFCKKVVSKWKPKVIHGIFAGIAVIIFALLIYFAFSLRAVYAWDAGNVYNAAVASTRGEQIASTYFATYPNNIFLFLILKVFYKVIFAITGSTDIILSLIHI